MKSNVFSRAGCSLAILIVAATTSVQAETPHEMKFSGVINDFTPASTGGPWEVRGPWSLVVKEKCDKGERKGDFVVALTMERSDLGVIQNGGGNLNKPMDRMAHTHHITLIGGEVTEIPGGIQVTGPAKITANGVFPPPFGSTLPTLTIEITGSEGEDGVPYSNVTVQFGNPAAGHFGTSPLHGVVVRSSR